MDIWDALIDSGTPKETVTPDSYESLEEKKPNQKIHLLHSLRKYSEASFVSDWDNHYLKHKINYWFFLFSISLWYLSLFIQLILIHDLLIKSKLIFLNKLIKILLQSILNTHLIKINIKNKIEYETLYIWPTRPEMISSVV